MAWNEPGGGKRDPWGGGARNDGPPDLDEMARKLRERMNSFFGGKSGRGAGTGKPFNFSLLLVVAIGGLGAVRHLHHRAGRARRSAAPGRIPTPSQARDRTGIRAVSIPSTSVDVDRLRTVSHRAKMLTKDENIIQVELAVQYQVKDAKDYLFQVRDPDFTLQEASESALREVIGSSTMDEFFSGGRGEIVRLTKELTQETLDRVPDRPDPDQCQPAGPAAAGRGAGRVRGCHQGTRGPGALSKPGRGLLPGYPAQGAR